MYSKTSELELQKFCHVIAQRCIFPDSFFPQLPPLPPNWHPFIPKAEEKNKMLAETPVACLRLTPSLSLLAQLVFRESTKDAQIHDVIFCLISITCVPFRKQCALSALNSKPTFSNLLLPPFSPSKLVVQEQFSLWIELGRYLTLHTHT